jgi:HEAT repeat protein
MRAALDLMDQLDAAEKNALRTTMWPLLVRIAGEGNYLEMADAARILRGLPHADNLPLLLQLLGRKEFVGQPTAYLAAIAIRELGPGVRARAVSGLIQMLEAESKQQNYRTVGGEPPAPLLALAWIGGSQEFQRTTPIRGDYLRPLWGAGLKPDEGAFLLEVLSQPGKLPPDAIEWTVIRLGELKDRRATAALFQQLQKSAWPVTDRAQQALIRIGGVPVEAGAKALLAPPQSAPVREAALKILYELEGAGSLPYLRQSLSDRLLRTTALLLLGNVGTPQDLRVLLPMSDFWTGDREAHYWAMQAIAGIRARNP